MYHLYIRRSARFKYYFSCQNTFTQVHVSRVVEFHLLTLVQKKQVYVKIHDLNKVGLNDDKSHHIVDRVSTTNIFEYYDFYTRYMLLTNNIRVLVDFLDSKDGLPTFNR